MLTAIYDPSLLQGTDLLAPADTGHLGTPAPRLDVELAAGAAPVSLAVGGDGGIRRESDEYLDMNESGSQAQGGGRYIRKTHRNTLKYETKSSIYLPSRQPIQFLVRQRLLPQAHMAHPALGAHHRLLLSPLLFPFGRCCLGRLDQRLAQPAEAAGGRAGKQPRVGRHALGLQDGEVVFLWGGGIEIVRIGGLVESCFVRKLKRHASALQASEPAINLCVECGAYHLCGAQEDPHLRVVI